MRTNHLFLILACAGLIGACATAPPTELVEARQAYLRAAAGPAGDVAPADVHIAGQALDKAEKSFNKNENNFETRDLAYVALRKAERAEAIATIAIQQKNRAQAEAEFEQTQAEMIKAAEEDLARSRMALAASQQSGAMKSDVIEAEKAARASAEARLAAAQAALANLAMVKEEARGTVITLSGSVLFASNQSELLPAAQDRLEQVVDVLLSTAERSIIVEGHTDSRGSDSYNVALGQRRAEAVRNYIIQKGYEPDLIRAVGVGEGRPIADNDSPEGRANNRRVEIVIENETAM